MLASYMALSDPLTIFPWQKQETVGAARLSVCFLALSDSRSLFTHLSPSSKHAVAPQPRVSGFAWPQPTSAALCGARSFSPRTCTCPLSLKPAHAFRCRLTHSNKHNTSRQTKTQNLKASQKRAGRGGQHEAFTLPQTKPPVGWGRSCSRQRI